MKTAISPCLSISSITRGAVGMLTAATMAAAVALPAVAANEETTCWTQEPGVVGAIDHPADPMAIVLRMSVGGGFVPQEFAFMENPTFTLYGNDVAIYRPAGQLSEMNDPLPAFACSRLSPDQVDELLTFALDEGGLRAAREHYPNPYIVDTPNTLFTIDAGGTTKSVVVEALGFDDMAPPNPKARAQFQVLADRLSDFDTVVESSQPYDVPLYEGLVTVSWSEQEGAPVPWPWDDVPVSAFGADLSTIVSLTPEQVAQVTTVPSGGQAYILVETPDGTVLNLTIRPLLPEEGLPVS